MKAKMKWAVRNSPAGTIHLLRFNGWVRGVIVEETGIIYACFVESHLPGGGFFVSRNSIKSAREWMLGKTKPIWGGA